MNLDIRRPFLVRDKSSKFFDLYWADASIASKAPRRGIAVARLGMLTCRMQLVKAMPTPLRIQPTLHERPDSAIFSLRIGNESYLKALVSVPYLLPLESRSVRILRSCDNSVLFDLLAFLLFHYPIRVMVNFLRQYGGSMR